MHEVSTLTVVKNFFFSKVILHHAAGEEFCLFQLVIQWVHVVAVLKANESSKLIHTIVDKIARMHTCVVALAFILPSVSSEA